MIIVKRPVKNFSNREGYKQLFIVNHIMSGTIDGSENWFNNYESKASSNYGISKKGEVREWVDPKNKAWANGIVTNKNNPISKEFPGVNPNCVTISIEHEGETGEKFTEEMYNSTLELHKYLLTKYPDIKIDRDHIIGHYRIDPVKKLNCPGSGFPWDRLFNDLYEWQKYKAGEMAIDFLNSKGKVSNPELWKNNLRKIQYLDCVFIKWATDLNSNK